MIVGRGEATSTRKRDQSATGAAGTGAVLVIGGPTASGKSALALELAERLDGVVINADSMQVYRELPVLTAQPDAAARARAPHRLYGVLPGDAPCSAGRWRELALAEIDAALAAGRRPIVVGGTGLYLSALTQGIADIPPVPDAVRAEATALYDRLGGAAFRAALAERDSAAAARLPPGDRQRLIRAWEVAVATGRPLSDWQAGPDATPPPHLAFDAVLVLPPRADLYAACDARFAAMMDAGAPDEVRALAARGLDPGLPVMKALGVPELLRHLAGALPREEAVRLARQATRRYAKRQYTWFRHRGAMPRAPLRSRHVIEQFPESMTPEIIKIVRKGH
jgi:tRNA dimethylallyltransferase